MAEQDIGQRNDDGPASPDDDGEVRPTFASSERDARATGGSDRSDDVLTTFVPGALLPTPADSRSVSKSFLETDRCSWRPADSDGDSPSQKHKSLPSVKASPDDELTAWQQSFEKREIFAARKIQKLFHRWKDAQDRQKAESEAIASIQRKYRKTMTEAEKATLKLKSVALHRLEDAAVQELRMLARSGSDARPVDEDQRFYDILMHLPPFREVLEPLPHRARICAIRRLEPRQLLPKDSLLRNTEGDKVDPVGLVLAGEAAIYITNLVDGSRRVTQRLRPGMVVSASMVDEDRINEECRDSYSLQVSSKRPIEVLRLSREFLEDAISEEADREAYRSAALETLRSSAPWCRQTGELQRVSDHLLANVVCFQGVSEEDVDVVCQQANLIRVGAGEFLCRHGEEADGLRVLLSGTASKLLPRLAALEGLPTTIARNDDLWAQAACPTEMTQYAHERGDLIEARPKTFGDCINTLCVDDSCGEWELCFMRNDRSMADVVADCDCEALFISRALYTRHMLPSRRDDVLGEASLAALMHGSAALLKAERFAAFDMSQPLWQVSAEEASMELVQESRLTQGSVSRAPVWMLPESVAAIDCMFGDHDKCSLPLLKSFPRDLRRRFCARGKLWRALRGEVLFREGDPGDLLFVVVRGEVGLFQSCDDEDPDFLDQRQELSRQLQHKGACAINDMFAKRGPEFEGSSNAGFDFGPTQSEVQNAEFEDAQGSNPIADLALSLYDVAARRWQNLWPVRVSALPLADAERVFVRDEEADKLLVGSELQDIKADNDAPCRGTFVEVKQIGLCTAFAKEGQALGIAAPGRPGAGPPRSHTAVALSATTDLFVLDHEAISEVLSAECEGIPSGEWASAILRARKGMERTPQDLLVLESLIGGHQAFMNLECCTRAEICRKMSLVTVPQGETVCKQGDEAIGFFQVLSGQASLHVRQDKNPHVCLFAEEEAAIDVDDPGPMILCLGEGSTFGEQALLGKEGSRHKKQPQTILAVEDLELAWISSHDYENATRDWLGEASMRRRALDVLRQPVEQRKDQDVEAVIHVLRHVRWLQELDAAVRLEVARHMCLCHVPQGEYYLPHESKSSAFCLHDESYTLSVVLAGCIGRYPDIAVEESVKEVQARRRFLSWDEEEKIGPEPQDSKAKPPLKLTKKALARATTPQQKQAQDLQDLRLLMDRLTATIGCEPLKASLKQRLQIHSVRKKMKELESKMGIVPLHAASQDYCARSRLVSCDDAMSAGPSLLQSEASRGVSRCASPGPGTSSKTPSASASLTTLGAGETKLFASESACLLGLPAGSIMESSWLDNGMSADRDSSCPRTFDLTQMVDKDCDFGLAAENLPPGLMSLDGCDLEFREGDAFGGWTEAEPAECADQKLYAHTHSDILFLTRASYEAALTVLKQRQLKDRAKFLRSHLPSETTGDVIEKITPMFAEESKQKGCVLVREGFQSNTIWIVVEGTCHCTKAQSSLCGLATALCEDEHRHDKADADLEGHKCGGARPGRSGERKGKGMAEKPLTPMMDTGGDRSSIPTELKAPTLPDGISRGRCATARGMAVGGNGHAPVTVGLLNKGKLIGLFSALFHRPEPLTVNVSSAHAKLLAISTKKFLANLPEPVFDVLKTVLRSQSDWHGHQSARLAALPDQVAVRLDSVRCEVHQSHVPRMIDSPFLRRHGKPGLEMLDNIVNRYGRMVHPESEWLFASRTPEFFNNVRLANLEEGHAEAAFYEYPQLPDGKPKRANVQFRRFNNLSLSIQEESGDNDYLASVCSNEVAGLSPKSVSKLGPSSFERPQSQQIARTGIQVPADRESDATISWQPSTTSILEVKMKEIEKERVVLLMHSSVHHLTEQSELRHSLQLAIRTAPPEKIISPGREVHQATGMQVYKSKAMRDRQLGIVSVVVDNPQHSSAHASKSRRQKAVLPPISLSVGSDSQTIPVDDGTKPLPPSTPRSTLRRGTSFLERPSDQRRTTLRRGSSFLEKTAIQQAKTVADDWCSSMDEESQASLSSRQASGGQLCRRRPAAWNAHLRELDERDKSDSPDTPMRI